MASKEAHNETLNILKSISSNDFLSFGKNQLCYIRPVYQQGAMMVGLFDADGEQLSVFPDAVSAKHAMFHHDIHTVNVH